MSPRNPHLLSKEDFDQYQWKAVLDQVEPKLCRNYSKEFQARAEACQLAGDAVGQEIFNFLSSITSILMEHLGLKDASTVDQAMLSILTNDQLALLRELVLTVTDPEMRARIADILWIYKRDPERSRPIQMARIAVESYLQAAKNLENTENERMCYQRLKRAAQLGPLVDGKKSTEICRIVVSHIEQLIDRYAVVKNEFLTGSAMKVLQEDLKKNLKIIQTNLPDYATEYAKLAAQKAVFAENIQDHHTSFHQKKAYRQIESAWYKIANNKEAEHNARLHLGEIEVCYAQQALLKNEPNPYAVAAGRIRRAITVFQKIEDKFGQRQDTSERIQELHKQMLAYQKQSMSQIVNIAIAEPNVFFNPDMQQKARELVKGKTLRDALYSLAFGDRLICTVRDLQTEAEERMQSYELFHLIPTAFVDKEGKTKAISGNGEDNLKNTMLEIAKFYQGWYGLNFIDPACRQICSEHTATLEDLSFVFHENSFIPKGRESLYAQGLIAGLKGDLVTAAHLLIPQLENSLRHILKQDGSIASKRETIQDDFLLHEVLSSPDLTSILKEDTIFTLKGLLVERMGSNLRNEICHGLLDYDQFSTPELPYFWWLTLRLCLVPTYGQWTSGQSINN